MKIPEDPSDGIGLDLRAVSADGTEIPVEISLSPITVAGQTAVAATMRDISRRKRAEDGLRQQNTALNASLAARPRGECWTEYRLRPTAERLAGYITTWPCAVRPGISVVAHSPMEFRSL